MRFLVNFKIIKLLFLIFLVLPFQLYAIEDAVVEGDSIGVDSVIIIKRLNNIINVHRNFNLITNKNIKEIKRKIS